VRLGSRRFELAIRSDTQARHDHEAQSDAFDSRVHLRASLPATIAREGRVLYVA
jgi:hypothetical protein